MNKPESVFIESVHRKLKKLNPPVIIKKLADRFTQGWPDVYYIGPFSYNLWVEYKVYPNKLTELQKTIIHNLVNYDEHVAVITKLTNKIAVTDYLVYPNDTIEIVDPAQWIATELGYP